MPAPASHSPADLHPPRGAGYTGPVRAARCRARTALPCAGSGGGRETRAPAAVAHPALDPRGLSAGNDGLTRPVRPSAEGRVATGRVAYPAGPATRPPPAALVGP